MTQSDDPDEPENAENGFVKCMYTLDLICNPQLHSGQTLSHLDSVSARDQKIEEKKSLWFY